MGSRVHRVQQLVRGALHCGVLLSDQWLELLV